LAFEITATLRAVESYLLASGYFGSQAQIGEPKSPPGEGLTATVFMDRAGVAELTLGGKTIEQHVVTLRIYLNMLAEPQEDVELTLAKVVQEVISDLLGDYDLGATIRNVDAAGQYGTSVGTAWGYVDVGGVMFRIADVTLPLVVDDSATCAP